MLGESKKDLHQHQFESLGQQIRDGGKIYQIIIRSTRYLQARVYALEKPQKGLAQNISDPNLVYHSYFRGAQPA